MIDKTTITPAQARRLGLDVLANLARDPKEAGGTRGAAAKELVNYGTTAEDYGDGITLADHIAYKAKQARRLIRALHCGLNSPRLIGSVCTTSKAPAAWTFSAKPSSASISPKKLGD